MSKYIEAVGRRKTSSARVRISKGSGKTIINGRDIKEYFPVSDFVNRALTPLTKLELTYDVSVVVNGGGLSAQSEAIRHGISRAIVKENEDLRKDLRAHDLLKRDPRSKERKKFGLKKARKAPQWSKR